MADSEKPDFKNGVLLNSIPDGGMVSGQVDGEEILLARRGAEVFATAAHCTHYHGPLAEGLMRGTRCAVPGTTLVSACEPAKPPRSGARSHSVLESRAGGRKGFRP